MQNLLAQITNPAVPGLSTLGGSGNSGDVGANILGRYLAVLIATSISLGGLAVLLYMTLGAIQWITAGGDSGKIDKARSRIVQSLMGLAILTSVTAIVTFIGPIFGIDILRVNFINQITGGASGSWRTGSSSTPIGPTTGNVKLNVPIGPTTGGN